jgi:hypothetical protein
MNNKHQGKYEILMPITTMKPDQTEQPISQANHLPTMIIRHMIQKIIMIFSNESLTINSESKYITLEMPTLQHLSLLC